MRRAARMFIMRESKVIVCKDKCDNDRNDGYEIYKLPGLDCLPGETFQDAAIKAVKIMTGLTIYNIKSLFFREGYGFVENIFMPVKVFGDFDKNEKAEWVDINVLLKGTFKITHCEFLKSLGFVLE